MQFIHIAYHLSVKSENHVYIDHLLIGHPKLEECEKEGMMANLFGAEDVLTGVKTELKLRVLS